MRRLRHSCKKALAPAVETLASSRRPVPSDLAEDYRRAQEFRDLGRALVSRLKALERGINRIRNSFADSERRSRALQRLALRRLSLRESDQAMKPTRLMPNDIK